MPVCFPHTRHATSHPFSSTSGSDNRGRWLRCGREEIISSAKRDGGARCLCDERVAWADGEERPRARRRLREEVGWRAESSCVLDSVNNELYVCIIWQENARAYHAPANLWNSISSVHWSRTDTGTTTRKGPAKRDTLNQERSHRPHHYSGASASSST